jgi:hypothetical protein
MGDCKHEHYVTEGDGKCSEGCCDKYRCLDCGAIFLVEGTEKLLTEAQLKKIERKNNLHSSIQPKPDEIDRLIADHRRMRQAIALQPHEYHANRAVCVWRSIYPSVAFIRDCTPETCIWMELNQQ